MSSFTEVASTSINFSIRPQKVLQWSLQETIIDRLLRGSIAQTSKLLFSTFYGNTKGRHFHSIYTRKGKIERRFRCFLLSLLSNEQLSEFCLIDLFQYATGMTERKLRIRFPGDDFEIQAYVLLKKAIEKHSRRQ